MEKSERDICPICHLKAKRQCKCPIGDMVCENNHSWFYCPADNNLIIGCANHFGNLLDCQCKSCSVNKIKTIEIEMPEYMKIALDNVCSGDYSNFLLNSIYETLKNRYNTEIKNWDCLRILLTMGKSTFCTLFAKDDGKRFADFIESIEKLFEGDLDFEYEVSIKEEKIQLKNGKFDFQIDIADSRGKELKQYELFAIFTKQLIEEKIKEHDIDFRNKLCMIFYLFTQTVIRLKPNGEVLIGH